jgi:RimJ/RimL family protein N-acetyltransferase
MTIEIRDSVQSDLDYVRNNPIDPKVVKEFTDLKLSGWVKTALLDGKILGFGGVIVFWKGVGEGFYCLSKEAADHKLEMISCIKSIIDLAFKELGLHRLQSVIRVDFERAIRLAEYVGFKKEGKMRKHTADKIDCFIFSIVKENGVSNDTCDKQE